MDAKEANEKSAPERNANSAQRMSRRLLPLASVVGAFNIVAAGVLGADGEAAPGGPTTAAGPSANLPPAMPGPPLPRTYSRSALIAGPGTACQFRRALAGLALGPRDAIYALGDDEVRVLEPGGRFAHSWKAPAKASCLGVAPDGRVVVGSPGRVDLYDAKGATRIGGFAAGTREKPAEVTALRFVRDEILVADAAAKIIRRYDLRGAELGVIGDRNKTGGFMLPNGSLDFDVDAAGVVHATDTGRHQVTSWTLDGKMVGSFGKFGMTRPEDFVGCCNPVNVAVAPGGDIVTAEKMIARVKVFDRDRALVAVIGPEHFDPMCRHIHVAVDSTGQIVAADPERRTIAVFKRS
ncbi:MAG: hypothetical protein ACM3NQ_06555 [Bacteroidales bacterium]